MGSIFESIYFIVKSCCTDIVQLRHSWGTDKLSQTMTLEDLSFLAVSLAYDIQTW